MSVADDAPVYVYKLLEEEECLVINEIDSSVVGINMHSAHNNDY